MQKLKPSRLLAFSIIALLCLSFCICFISLVPSVSAQAQLYDQITTFPNDSTVFPNNGIEMVTQTIAEPAIDNGTVWDLAVWTSETMSDGNWIQFGYTATGNSLNPFVCLLHANMTSISQLLGVGGYYAAYYDNSVSFINGTYHTFRMVFTSSTSITISIDGKTWKVLNPSFFNNIYTQNGHPELADLASFATTSTYGIIMTAVESWDFNVHVLVPIDMSVAMAYLQNGSWFIPDMATSTSQLIGQLQNGENNNPQLKFGEAIFFNQYPGGTLWHGTPTYIGSNSLTPTSTPTSYNESSTFLSSFSDFVAKNLVIMPFLIGVAAMVALAFSTKNRNHKHRR